MIDQIPVDPLLFHYKTDIIRQEMEIVKGILDNIHLHRFAIATFFKSTTALIQSCNSSDTTCRLLLHEQ